MGTNEQTSGNGGADKAATAQRKAIRELAKVAFPEWKGRRLSLVERPHYVMSDFWADGSREYAAGVELSTGRILSHGDMAPWDPLATSTVTIPAGFGVLVHAVFCGHDAGVTLYVRPGQAFGPAEKPAKVADSRPRVDYALPDGRVVPVIHDHGQRVGETCTFEMQTGEVVIAKRVGAPVLPVVPDWAGVL